MKLLGAVLILLSGLCLGIRKAGELRRREAALLDLQRTIRSFKTGIAYASQPLAELIRSNGDSRFCVLAVREISFPQEPKTALKRAGEALLQEPDDRELYRGLIRGLGQSDTQGQMEHLELYSALLEANLSASREAKEKKSRLYVCLGLFGGAALCLMLV